MSENPALELLRTFFAGAGFQEVPATKTYTRDDIVRVVLGQQWAVAMCLMSPEAWAWAGDHGGSRVGQSDWNNRLAALPCAVDVVEGMEKP